VTATSPPRIASTPSSCAALGSSPKISAARSIEPTGWIVSSTEVWAAGRRGSELAISSQPTTCELSASNTSQPCAGQLGARSASPTTSPAAIATTAATAVASKSGPAARRRSLPLERSSRMNPA